MKENIEVRDLAPALLRASFNPKSFNAEKRTMDLIFSTGARVKRRGGAADFYHEELSLKPEHVRLGRLNSGAPYMQNHGDHGFCGGSPRLRDILGVVEAATVDGKKGIATVRFTQREEAQPIINDIVDGIIRNVSVGYVTHKAEEIGRIKKNSGDKDEIGEPIFRATDWEPIEISSVYAGADDGAKTRSIEDLTEQRFPCELVRMNKVTGDESSKPPAEEPTGTETRTEPENGVDSDPALNETETTGDRDMKDADKAKLVSDSKSEGAKAEKQRQKDIRHAVKSVNLDEKFADELIERDISVEDARTEVIDKAAEENAKKATRSPTIEAGAQDADDTRRKGMTDALLHRTNSSRYKLTDEAKPYAYRSLLRMGEDCLTARGVSVIGQRADEIAVRSLHSTSDFPLILANVAGKTLRDEYEGAPRTFEPFTRPATARDFKEIQRTQLSDAPSLEALGEHGEVKAGKMSEAAEKYSLATYAKKIGITRQVIVNDDLGAIGRIPASMGRAARDLESDLVYAHLVANGAMSDTNNLFSAAHGNYVASGSGAPPSETTLNAGRAAMRKQTGLAGRILNLFPIYMAVPAELETVGEKLVTTINPQDSSKVNAFAPGGRTPLQLIVEPRLALATAWYLFSRLDAIDILEILRLEGAEAPVVATRENFDIEGMEIKVRHDVAVKAIDWRGAYFNYGA
jgi:hypothetical protein